MNDSESRRLQMFARVRDFGTAHTADFAANSIGKELFTTLATTITEVDSHGSAEASGVGLARQGTATRTQARDELREDLDAIKRTARALEDAIPGISDKFRVPKDNNDQSLLSAARAFATDAAP